MYEDYTQNEYSDLTHMQMNQEAMQPQPEDEKKKHKKEKKAGNAVLKSAVNGLVFGLCAAVVFCGVAAVGNRTFLKTEEQTQTAATSEKQTTQIASTQTAASTAAEGGVEQTSTGSGAFTVKEIAQNSKPSIVSITTKSIEEVRSMFGTQEYESEGAGSGIIVGQSDTELLIATNNHVITGATEVSVCFNDSEDAVVAASVKGTDASNDLAIVSIPLDTIDADILSSIKIATLGDSTALEVGDQVVAIGNALGYGQSVTTGIVSALDREVTIDSFTAELIQTDAAINPGNSGGALLNMKGELIGINSAKFAASSVEGMGYAIPTETAKPILDDLMNRETRELASEEEAGYLGVSIQDVSEEATAYYDIPTGAYIAAVEEGGGAAEAGLKKGDIITKFDGLTITSASELKGTVAYYRQGETVEVIYMRSNNGVYEEQTCSVTLAKSAQIEEQNEQSSDRNAQRGFTVPDMDSGESEEGYEDFFGGFGLEDFFNQFYEEGSGSQYDTQQEPAQGERGI